MCEKTKPPILANALFNTTLVVNAGRLLLTNAGGLEGCGGGADMPGLQKLASHAGLLDKAKGVFFVL